MTVYPEISSVFVGDIITSPDLDNIETILNVNFSVLIHDGQMSLSDVQYHEKRHVTKRGF